MTEIEALKVIDDVLSAITEQQARKRILAWACEKFLQHTGPMGRQEIPHAIASQRRKNRGRKGNTQKQKAPPVSLVKDLNLKPKGKQSLDAFVQAKNPQSLYEKCTLAIHYLKNELSISNVSVNHVYTCFKHMQWKLPSNLGNTLSYTASHHGWLDTSNMQDLKLTAIGENLVEHDLPRVKKS